MSLNSDQPSDPGGGQAASEPLSPPAQPDPTRDDDRDNAYVFERHVRIVEGDGSHTTGRINLCKRRCFVPEAKQVTARGNTVQCEDIEKGAAVAHRQGGERNVHKLAIHRQEQARAACGRGRFVKHSFT